MIFSKGLIVTGVSLTFKNGIAWVFESRSQSLTINHAVLVGGDKFVLKYHMDIFKQLNARLKSIFTIITTITMLKCCIVALTSQDPSLSLSLMYGGNMKILLRKKNSQTQSICILKQIVTSNSAHYFQPAEHLISICLSVEWIQRTDAGGGQWGLTETHTLRARVCECRLWSWTATDRWTDQAMFLRLSNTNHQQNWKIWQIILCEQFIPMYLNLSGAFKAQLHSAVQTVNNNNNNLVYLYTVLFWALKSALHSKGGISSSTTSVQHPPGWCDGSHSAPECPPHTSYRWRGDSDEANQCMGMIRRPWWSEASGRIWSGHQGYTPTLFRRTSWDF